MNESAIQKVIVKYSLLYGLASFIPLPLVDSYTQDLLAKRMTKKIFQHYDRPISDANAKLISQKSGGFCWGCIAGVLIWPVKKLIKTIAFFLSFKSLSDEIASCSIRAITIQQAILLGWNEEDKEGILKFKAEIEIIEKKQAASVVKILYAILESSKRGVRKLLWGLIRRIRAQKEEEIEEELIAPIYEALFSNEEQIESIRTQLQERLNINPALQKKEESQKEPKK